MSLSPDHHRPGRILLEQTSPDGNVLATVEEQAGAVYLYLHGAEQTSFVPRACWVRNLHSAPEQIDESAMKRGEPPLMPAHACAHPQGAAPLDEAKLGFLWFEEGDAIALFEGNELLVIVPGWAGRNNFNGYARDCIEQTRLAWPLKTAELLLPRLASDEAFWRSWGTEKPWPGIRDAMLNAYGRAFAAQQSAYYSIDGGKWPPRAIARYQTAGAVVLVTLGMSIRPQPTVEMYVDDPRLLRRIEIGVALDQRGVDEEEVMSAVKFLAAQANLPWTAYSWMGNGHTLGCDASPAGPGFDAMLLLKSASGAPPVNLPAYRDDPVNLLWLIPITESERQFSVEKGAGELLARLAPRFPLWPRRLREPVV